MCNQALPHITPYPSYFQNAHDIGVQLTAIRWTYEALTENLIRLFRSSCGEC